MPASQVAETLYSAHKSRATGRLTLSAGGRQSLLFLQEGDLVGTRLGFGFQTPVQSLLQAGRIPAGLLDALWARDSAGAPDEDLLEELGLESPRVAEQQVLAEVRRLSALAEHASFEEDGVEEMFQPIAGARVVRAALESSEGEPAAPRMFRCPDAAACAAWVSEEAEQALLSSLTDFQRLEALPRDSRALLQVLEREEIGRAHV